MFVERNDDVKIYALTSREDLDSREFYIEYEKRLSKVFESDNDLWNVAVSGSYGVGKSSILHTYSKKKNKNFLYISLIDFSKQVYEEEAQNKNDNNQENEAQNKSDYNQRNDNEGANQIDFLEANLFRQILAYCSKYELPRFRYNMVPEEDEKINIKFFLLVFYITILLCSLFSHYISDFVHLLGYDFYGYGCLSLHLTCIAMTAILFGVGIFYFFKYGRIKEIELKTEPNIMETKVDVSITEESVLEKYRFDLIYVIEKLSTSYDAIIFEDMDRLDTKKCTSIFSQLREINFSVNNRMKKRLRNKSFMPMRFIYVVNDGLLAQLNQTKFFDYIMSIVPTLGYLNSKNKFELEILNSMPIQLTCDEKEKILSVVDICSDLSDYRILNQIKNDYLLFYSIQRKQNTHFGEYARLLAFVMYKVLCPSDYHLIRSNKSFFFPLQIPFEESEWIARGGKTENYQVAKKLTEVPVPLLDVSCLKFVGYSKEERKKILREALLNDEAKRKKLIIQTDTLLCIEVLKNEHESDIVEKMIRNIEDEIVLNCLEYFQILSDNIKTHLLNSQNKHTTPGFIEKLEAVLLQQFNTLPLDSKKSLYVFVVCYCVNMEYTISELRWFYSIDFELMNECLKILKDENENAFNIVFNGCSQAQRENYNSFITV